MISLCLPTRGRPESVKRFVENAVDNASGDDFEIVFWVDDDDQESWDTLGALDAPISGRRGPRTTLSDCWNKAASQASGDILGMMADDIVIRTPCWNLMVEAEFAKYPDRIVFVHGDDGLQHAALGTHGFLHRRWVEAVGRFLPPYFSADYCDTWLNDVAVALGRRVYLPELFTEHMHPSAGKAEWDQSHMERMERLKRDCVEQVYIDTAPERASEVAILRELIQ